MFIFEVLVETLLCGETVMEAETFPAQYAALHERNPLTGNTYVEEHFRVSTTSKLRAFKVHFMFHSIKK